MPKVKPTALEAQTRESRAVLMDWLTVHGKSEKDFGACIGSHENTGRKRLNFPEQLTISDIRKLKGLTDEQIVRLVRGKPPDKQIVNIYLNGIKL